MDPKAQSKQELNARADAGSFSNAGSLADLEAEVQRRKKNRFVVSRRKWSLNALVGFFAFLILLAAGFGTYKFFNSRWVRQPADFFATQQLDFDLADLQSGVATLPISDDEAISQFGLNGDLSVAGSLSLSQQGVEDLAQNLTNKLDLQASFPGVAQFGNVNIAGTVGAAAFVGGGSQLTDLAAANYSSGVLANVRLNPDVSLLGQSLGVTQIQPNIVSSVNSLVNDGGSIDLVGAGGISISAVGGSVQVDSAAIASGVAEVVAGSGLTGGGSASPVSIGFDGTNTIQGNTFNGASQLVQLDGGALVPVIDGSLLTNLNASSLVSGTINNSRLSANIVYRDADTNVLAPSSDSTSAFSVRNSSGATDVINVDTVGQNVSIGYPAATVNGYRLNVNGDLNVEPPISTLLINGVQICGALTCAIQDGNTNYIQNGTTLQTSANIAVQSAGFSTTTMRIKTLAGQTSFLIDVEDSSLVAKFRVRNISVGEVFSYGETAIQSDSTAALLVQNTSLVNDVLRADTTNNRVGIGQLSGNLPNYTLDVNGDTNLAAGSSMRIDGTAICTSTGCSSDGSATSYINNSTTTQTANLSVQSANAADTTAVVMGAVAQSANIVSIENSSTAMMQISATGDVLQKTTTNSVNGFTVNDSLANEVLGVSTTDSSVNIGDGGLTAKLGVTASSTVVGQIIDNSGTGQSLQIKKSGTNVVTVADTGDTTIQPSVNTTTAMTVKNATGGSILQASTGYSSGDSTPSLVFNGAGVAGSNAWSTNATDMEKAVRSAAYVYAGGHVYRFGGTDSASITSWTTYSDIYSAPVNVDGSIGTWAYQGDIGTSFPDRTSPTAAFHNGKLVLEGGFRFSTPSNADNCGSIYRVKSGGAATAADTIGLGCVGGNWAAEGAIATDGVGNFIISGGTNNRALSPNTQVYSQQLREYQGGAWPSETALPAARGGHTSVMSNGYIYVIGGYSGSNESSPQTTIYYAPISYSADIYKTVTVGAWSTTTTLPAARMFHYSAVANGYLYVWGGHDGTSALSSVIYAKINNDGTLGSWQTSSYTMPGTSYRGGGLAINGRLYTFGGMDNGGSVINKVYNMDIGRIRSYGSLDVIGHASDDLVSKYARSASGVSADSVLAKGNLQVTGSSQFANGISVLERLGVGGDLLVNTTIDFNSSGLFVNNSSFSRVFSANTYTDIVAVNADGSGANARLYVTGGTASQNLMQVTDTTATSSNVMTIADGGATTFKNQTDSTAALAVQNTAAATIFSVDTTNTQVVVGDSTTAVNIKFTQNSSTRSAITRDFVCTSSEVAYDVVAFSAADTVARTTTANSNRVAGVVVSKPNSTTCTTAIYGVVQVYFGANANPTTIGDPVVTSATTGAAQATTTPTAGALLGNSLGNKDGSNRVWVRLRRD